jgi:alpha-ribazole phosphatase
MDIYLVRHTAVVPGREICYGRTDVDVLDTFEEEGEAVRRALGDAMARASIITSPLTRCRKLATLLSDTEPEVDGRITEFDFGEWEMKRWDSIDRIALAKWSEDFINSRSPGGESFRALYDRSRDFWEDLVARPLKTAIVVTHYGIIHALLAHILSITLENSFMIHIDYGGITRIRVGRRRTTLDFINR